MTDFLISFAGAATTTLVSAIITALLVVFVGKYVLKWLEKRILKLNVDATLHKFLFAVVRVLLYFFAIMIVASSLGFQMSSLVALASVVSAAFALAASGVLSNIFGGLLLLITKPFAVGDFVNISGNEGTVLELGILATKINTVDNKRIIMPNSSISATTIVNYTTEGKRRVDIVFDVSYDANVDEVKKAITNVALAHDKVVEKDSIFVRVSAYNDSNVSYTTRVWCKSEDYWTVYFDLMEQVKKAFDENGIDMVYPYINVINVSK